MAEQPMMDDHDDEKPGKKQRLESLATLSARAVESYLIEARRNISKEADNRIAERRNALERKILELEEEKEEDIKKETALFDKKQALILERMTPFPDCIDSYCSTCKKLFRTRPESEGRCSVAHCRSHLNCPICECQPLDGTNQDGSWIESLCPDPREDLLGDVYTFECFFDNCPGDAGPSKTGYLKCWICEVEFCNHDFQKHYTDCRSKVGSRCGFRIPSQDRCKGGSKAKSYLCSPGFCGMELGPGKTHIYWCDHTGPYEVLTCGRCITESYESFDSD